MNMKDLLIALAALVLLCLVGPIVVGILSALVAVAPYLLAVLLLMGVIAFFCKELRQERKRTRHEDDAHHRATAFHERIRYGRIWKWIRSYWPGSGRQCRFAAVIRTILRWG